MNALVGGAADTEGMRGRTAARPAIGPETVLARARGVRVPPANAEVVQSTVAASIPSLKSEERLLLGMVNGRLSVSRLARASRLPEGTVVSALDRLLARNLVVPLAPTIVTIEGQSGEAVCRLGSYEISTRVGQGGMGAVYVSRRTGASGFRRLFALKVMRQDGAEESFALQSFARELEVGRLLRHPNVQSVVDVGMHNEHPFLVLDYVEGTDLEELAMFAGGPLDPAVVVTALVDLLRGLQRAHQTVDERGQWLGLVHGDVSPPNILVGVDGVTRLADFGSARFPAAGHADRVGSVALGKPAFMAPEQLRGEQVDATTDLFSVGVVLWTALTGRELFAAPAHEQTVRNVQGREIPPPSAHGAPSCLDRICLRALSRERQRRYATADDFAADLLRVAVTNGLLASATRVGLYVREQLGETIVERQRQLDAGFPSVPRPEVPAVGRLCRADSSGVPPLPRERIARTVVLPSPAAPLPTLKPRWSRDGRVQLFLLAVLAMVVFAVMVALAGAPQPTQDGTAHVTSRVTSSGPASRGGAP